MPRVATFDGLRFHREFVTSSQLQARNVAEEWRAVGNLARVKQRSSDGKYEVFVRPKEGERSGSPLL